MAASILHALSYTDMHLGIEGDLQQCGSPGLAYLVVLWHTAGNVSPCPWARLVVLSWDHFVLRILHNVEEAVWITVPSSTTEDHPGRGSLVESTRVRFRTEHKHKQQTNENSSKTVYTRQRTQENVVRSSKFLCEVINTCVSLTHRQQNFTF